MRQNPVEFSPEKGSSYHLSFTTSFRQSIDYAAPKQECDVCSLRPQCTRNKTSGRTIKRHLRQTELDQMRQRSHSPQEKRDIRTRQHLMERSSARGRAATVLTGHVSVAYSGYRSRSI
ncbi:transposase [Thermodesulfobacteriota bacterium]